MDYKNKYLKYKQKYLELKKELYGRGKLDPADKISIKKIRTFDELKDLNKNNEEFKKIRKEIIDLFTYNDINIIKSGFLPQNADIITTGILKDYYTIESKIIEDNIILEGRLYKLKENTFEKLSELKNILKIYFPLLKDIYDKTKLSYLKYHVYMPNFITNPSVLLDLNPYNNNNNRNKYVLNPEYQNFAYVLRDEFV